MSKRKIDTGSKLDGRPHPSGIIGHGRVQTGQGPKPPKVQVHRTGMPKQRGKGR